VVGIEASKLLTQETVDRLLKINKKCVEPEIKLPPQGKESSYDVVSEDGREQFLLDVNRVGVIKLSRCTMQERYAVSEQLIRLDLDESKPHRNPDGIVICGAHIHIYKAGYNDAWAYLLAELPEFKFSDTQDITQTFIEFCSFCNIDIPDVIQGTF